MEAVRVEIRATVPLPSTPPFVRPMPAKAEPDWWRGFMLDWRWLDEPAGKWSAFVEYARADGFKRLHWVPGELVRRAG